MQKPFILQALLMDLSIVIINYNTFQLTCACIESVLKFARNISYEIIVVDNASPKDNADDFLVRFPQIKLVKNPENNGFAKGNNLGIQHAQGNYILLLNSDAYLIEDCLSPAVDYLQHHRDIAALSVKILYPNGRFQKTARRFRSVRNELLDLLRPMMLLLPYRSRATLMLNQYFRGDFDVEVDWVSGAFMMFPRKILEQLPARKLDERFFMYGEDELWCYHFQQLGYRNYFLSTTSVVHIANASTAPSKQLQLLKTMIAHELEIMREMHGCGLYYQTLKAIFLTKEYGRYWVKVLVWKMTGKKVR
jgi:GT2 family glycosyltransferase